jgi:hypothetical protein
MRSLYRVTTPTLLAILLSGCLTFESVDSHTKCGFGVDPVASYAACIRTEFARHGVLGNLDAQAIMTEAALVAEQERSGKITNAEAYSRIMEVRLSPTKDPEMIKWKSQKASGTGSAYRSISDPMLEAGRALLRQQEADLQRRNANQDYWQEYRDGRTIQCRRLNAQVYCQ